MYLPNIQANLDSRSISLIHSTNLYPGQCGAANRGAEMPGKEGNAI